MKSCIASLQPMILANCIENFITSRLYWRPLLADHTLHRGICCTPLPAAWGCCMEILHKLLHQLLLLVLSDFVAVDHRLQSLKMGSCRRRIKRINLGHFQIITGLFLGVYWLFIPNANFTLFDSHLRINKYIYMCVYIYIWTIYMDIYIYGYIYI